MPDVQVDRNVLSAQKPKNNIVNVVVISGIPDFWFECQLLEKITKQSLLTFTRKHDLFLNFYNLSCHSNKETYQNTSANHPPLEDLISSESYLNFIYLFVGSKYGDPYLPRYIDVGDMDKLRRVANEARYDVKLLADWYWLDESAAPCYVRRACQRQELADWPSIQCLLVTTIHHVANLALRCGLMKKTEFLAYTKSAYEHEVTSILDQAASFSDQHTHILVLKRSFEDMDDIPIEKLHDYIDIDGGEIDESNCERLRQMYDGKVAPRVTSSPTGPGCAPGAMPGDSADASNHYVHEYSISAQTYLDDCNLDSDGVTSIADTLDCILHKTLNWLKERNRRDSQVVLNKSWDMLSNEALEHAVATSRKNRLFSTSDLGDLKSRFFASFSMDDEMHPVGSTDCAYNNNNVITEDISYRDSLLVVPPPTCMYHMPLILHGRAGCGLSATVSHVIRCSAKWSNSFSGSVIVRHVGCTSYSNDIHPILSSICHQIWMIYDMDERPNLRNYTFTQLYFSCLLRRLPVSEDKPLLIVVDGLSYLRDHHARAVNWIPRILPEHVRIVVTLISNPSNLRFDLLQKLIPETRRYFELHRWKSECTMDILKLHRRASNRRLHERHRRAMIDSCCLIGQPVYVSICAHMAQTWRSYDIVDSNYLSDSIANSIICIISRIESRHSKNLVKRCLELLSLSRDGLTLEELMTALNIDDNILKLSLGGQKPRDEDCCGVSVVQVLRILQECSMLVLTQVMDGQTVYIFRYSMFNDILRPHDLSTQRDLHHILSDVFLGFWYQKSKSFDSTSTLASKKLIPISCVRSCLDQPLWFTSSRPNTRKLRLLVHHLICARRYGVAYDTCRSFDWLLAHSKVFGIETIIAEVASLKNAIEDSLRGIHPSTLSDPSTIENARIFGRLARDQLARVAAMSQRESHAHKASGGGLGAGLNDNTLSASSNALEQRRASRRASRVTFNPAEATLDEPLKLSTLVDCYHLASSRSTELYNFLETASSAVYDDWRNLPIEIVSQLGDQPDLHFGLVNLLADARHWLQSTAQPLLVPSSSNHVARSPFLRYEIKADIYDAYNVNNSEVCKRIFIHDHHHLYTMSVNPVLGSLFCEYSIQDHERVLISQHRLDCIHIKSFQIVNGAKYLLLQKTDDSSLVINLNTWKYVHFDSSHQNVINISENGKYALLKHSSDCKDYRKPTMIGIATLVTMSSMKHKCMCITAYGTTPEVTAAMFSGDARYVILRCCNQTSQVFSCENLKLIYSISGASSPKDLKPDLRYYKTMFMLPKKCFVSLGQNSSNEHSVLFRDLTNGNILQTMSDPSDLPINHMVLHDRMHQLITISDENVLLFHIGSAQLIAHISGSKCFTNACFCIDGYLLTTSSCSIAVSLWNYSAKDGQLTNRLTAHFVGHTSPVCYMAIIDGDLITTAADNVVKCWRLSEAISACNEQLRHSRPSLPISDWSDVHYCSQRNNNNNNNNNASPTLSNQIHVDQKNEKITIVAKDGRILRSDLNSGRLSSVTRVDGIQISRCYDNNKIVIVSKDHCYTIQNGSKKRINLPDNVKHLYCMCVAMDNEFVALSYEADCYSMLFVYNHETGMLINTTKSTKDSFQFMEFNSNNKLITNKCDWPICLNLLDNLPQHSTLNQEYIKVTCLAINSSFAALGTQDGRLQVLDLAANRRTCYFHLRHSVNFLTMSWANSEIYACCGGDILSYSLGGAGGEAGNSGDGEACGGADSDGGEQKLAETPRPCQTAGRLLTSLQRHRVPVVFLKVVSPLILISFDVSGTAVLWVLDEPTSFVVASSLSAVVAGGAQGGGTGGRKGQITDCAGVKSMHSSASLSTRCRDKLYFHSRLEYAAMPSFNGYSSLWKPNKAMSAMLAGKDKKVVSNRARKAQAIALSFSEAKIRTRTYNICRIL